jgi:RecJ-like exonuclease
MTEKKTRKKCPECGGKKIIPGVCECNVEWRGSQVDGEWNECKCTPDIPCPICNGTGFIEE